MPAGGESGRGAAIAAGLFKARIVILAVAFLLTALAVFAVFRTRPDLLIGAISLSALVALAWGCGVYLLLLSVRLALIAVAAPWIAWLWLLGIGAFWNVLPLATATFPIIIAGMLIAAFGLHAMSAALAQGEDKMTAVRSAFVRTFWLGILTLLATCAGMAATAYPNFRFGPILPIGLAVMLTVSLLLPPLAASLLPFNEAFIARANRARERREWLVSYFAMLSVPRWAFATVGIVAVLSTIVYFDSAFAPLWQVARKPYALAFAVIGLLGAIGLRNWRCFFSCGVAPFVAAITGAWAAVQLGLAPDTASETSLLVGSAAGAGFIYFLAAPTVAYQRAGDPMIIAFSRALNETGAAIIILACGLALALFIFSPGLVVLPLLDAVGALILFPAFATALDDLFPRRRPLNELYRAR